MTLNSYLQIALYLLVLLLLVKPLGIYMARVYNGENVWLNKLGAPLERVIYRLCGTRPDVEMTWLRYAISMLLFSVFGVLVVYGLQRLQAILPLNPEHMPAVSSDSSFNTAISFVTNTNWQGYGGESTMSYLTQMAGLAVQNFVSAATGMAILVALIRGFVRHGATTIGNFWADLTRGTLYILAPLSLVLAVVLVSQGVVQNFHKYEHATLVTPTTYQTNETSAAGASETTTVTQTEQILPMGPAASQIAIKQLGTNGGGYFNVNSAHPYENPTPLSNFLELLAILLIPAALCYTFGFMVQDTRQGWAILAAMTVIFVILLGICVHSEQVGNPAFHALGIDQAASTLQAGGNMEGKETRFGITNSALWATATTAASNGSVNSMHDSYTPLGGLVPLFMIQLGEVVYGGVGCGLYGMLVFAIVAVFIAGLMVGRTPEYLGKKIGSFEMKMVSVVVLITPLLVLVGTAIAVALTAGRAGPSNPGAHGFSEILYGFSSAANNNGSAFAGLNANTPFYNYALGIAMQLGRFVPAVAVLALAGSLATKKRVAPGLGTLPTHTPLFVVLLVGAVVLVGALAYIPALALGPIAEHLSMLAGH